MNENAQEGRQECLSRICAPFFPECEPVDRLFAVLYLLAGYGFIYVCSSMEFERNLAVFTVFYAAVVLLYLWGKEIRPPRESWFWLAVMLSAGIPYAFWSVLSLLQFPALMAVAAYWTLSASGRLLKTDRRPGGCFLTAATLFSSFRSAISDVRCASSPAAPGRKKSGKKRPAGSAESFSGW